MKVEEIKLAFETNIQFAGIDDLRKQTTDNALSRKSEADALANFYRQKAVKAQTLIKLVAPLMAAAKTLGDDAATRKLVSIELDLNDQIKTGQKNDSILRSIS